MLCKLRVQLFITINLQILCKIQQGHSHLYISLAPFFYMIEGSCLQQGVINAPEIQNRSMMELKQSFYFCYFSCWMLIVEHGETGQVVIFDLWLKKQHYLIC